MIGKEIFLFPLSEVYMDLLHVKSQYPICDHRSCPDWHPR